MTVYLSASPAERELAGFFSRGLGARGLDTCLGVDLLPVCRQEVRAALQRSAAVVVVVSRERRPTDAQRDERHAILSAVWRDPGKLLVPVLLGRAGLPPFLRSVFPAGPPIAVYRLRRPFTAWPRAVAHLAALVRREIDLAAVGELVDTAAEDRCRRLEGLAEVHRIAQTFPG